MDTIADLITRFNDALNRRDVNAMMALMSDDCVFENTSPAPDGTRYQGQTAVRQFWEDFFKGSKQANIEIEEWVVMDNRCVMRWIYRWMSLDGHQGHIRGVDIYTVKEGLITEKLSYVKG